MSLTINESGTAIAETVDGVTMPADFSLESVNDFVHSTGVSFEELQALCLGMSSHIDKLQDRLRTAENKNSELLSQKVFDNSDMKLINNIGFSSIIELIAEYEHACQQIDSIKKQKPIGHYAKSEQYWLENGGLVTLKGSAENYNHGAYENVPVYAAPVVAPVQQDSLDLIRKYLDEHKYRLIMFWDMWSLWQDRPGMGNEGFDEMVCKGKTLDELLAIVNAQPHSEVKPS